MEITQFQQSALCEIGNIGAGHAATALSALLQRRISMSVPKVWVVPFEQVSNIIGQMDTPQAAIYVKVEGEAQGKAVFFFPLESVEVILQTLFDSNDTLDLFTNKLAQSALEEVGNILVSSFLMALTQFSGIPLQPSVPAFAVDMIGASLDAIFLEEGKLEDTVFFIDTHFSGIPEIEGHFIFLPDESSLQKILGAMSL